MATETFLDIVERGQGSDGYARDEFGQITIVPHAELFIGTDDPATLNVEV